jgi:adenine deaminase
VAVGVNDDDMLVAIEHLIDSGGGQVVVQGENVISSLSLPVAGLMSDLPAQEVAHHVAENRAATKELGCDIENPFMALSFLSLPVIPKLKITDRGLVDVDLFNFVSLYCE